jgi:hypothetical protein
LSRGYGKLQLQLLTILAEHERSASASHIDAFGNTRPVGLDTPTLAQRVHGREPTRGELELLASSLLGQAGPARASGPTCSGAGLIPIALR